MDVEQVKLHFKTVDPVIFAALADVDIAKWYRSPIDRELYFHKLVDQIISQQLNVKVADIISARLLALVGEPHFSPAPLLKAEDEALRAVGLSKSKASYIKNLAALTEAGEIKFDAFATAAEEEIIAELTKVKGIGRWTAEMFLMFALGKPDVFSHGDYGLRSGIKKLYNLDDHPTLEEATLITDKWRPYRSFGSYALWQSLEKKG
ncbi:MAG: DNA-3-methyladenine glycosylase [Patescibacteria group bacterium]|jgi:DNA-3-methyladenine glycosylase II|nr:DNA-3-methyladenine glycosylase [Patescibacteria group bacterium]